MPSLTPEQIEEKKELKKSSNQAKMKVLMELRLLPPINTDDGIQLTKRINKYFEICIENGCIPALEGLCAALKISRSTWNDWRSGRYRLGQEHQKIVLDAEQILKAYMEQGILDGDIQSIPAIFMMSNQYDYVQKQVVQQETNVSFLDTATPEQLENRYSTQNVIDLIEEPTNNFKAKEDES